MLLLVIVYLQEYCTYIKCYCLRLRLCDTEIKNPDETISPALIYRRDETRDDIVIVLVSSRYGHTTIYYVYKKYKFCRTLILLDFSKEFP